MNIKKQGHIYLAFTVKILGWVNLWPQLKENRFNFIKQYYITLIIAVTTFPILADFIIQFHEDAIYLARLSENLIALSALYGVIYVSICFIQKKEEIKSLVEDLSLFEDFSPTSLIMETEKSINFYTKFFIIYGVSGVVCYGLMPFLNLKHCEDNKTAYMLEYGVPCGVVVRFLLPFKADYTPVAEIVALEEIFVVSLGTAIAMMVTMLICGVLIHITTHLKHLNFLILELSSVNDSHILNKKVKFCVKFHTAILDYAQRADSSFSRMMLLHITWTSLIISLLGFEIISVTNFVEILRFVMHLAGWLGMLSIICYYGQTLMDESSAISDAIYSISWYNKPVEVQKYISLILLRSQKSLTLKAGGIKIMSLATLLAVLYSAYSYFTLLLKFKH